MRRVMDHPEGIDQVVGPCRKAARKLLGIRVMELDLPPQAVDLGSGSSQLQGFGREIDSRDSGSLARKVDRVRADAASDFQYLFPLPAGEVGKLGDVGLDLVLPGLDLIIITASSYLERGMTDVTGTPIPVIPDMLDRDLVERRHGARESRFRLWLPIAE